MAQSDARLSGDVEDQSLGDIVQFFSAHWEFNVCRRNALTLSTLSSGCVFCFSILATGNRVASPYLVVPPLCGGRSRQALWRQQFYPER